MFVKSPLFSDQSDEARRVRRARDRMHEGKDPDPDSVRPLILESWRRSRSAGVDPYLGLKAKTQFAADAASGLSKYSGDGADRRLVTAAEPILELLTDALSDHAFALMLTDRERRTCWVAGTEGFVQEAKYVDHLVGGQWYERLIGTDAVALSHEIGEPVQVHWFEHYTAGLDPWTGNSAPIRDPLTRSVVGTINIYAYGCIAHPQAFELAKDAARIIERQLALGEQERRMHLLDAYESHLRRHPDEALVCLTQEGTILTLSPTAAPPLGLRPLEARGKVLQGLPGIRLHGIASDLAALTQAQDIDLQSGADRVSGELRPVHQEDGIAGFLLRLRAATLPRTARRPESPWQSRYRFEDLIGSSAELKRTLEYARRIARRDDTVLIVGETGTGKELMAHAIHADSARAGGPFVPINCGAMSGDLLSAEMFGYEDGAFTGATRGGRVGKLELADRGTLFLDEVEAMAPAMQVNLLRFLEDRAVIRVGSDRPRLVDVRVVAATNEDLGRLVRDGHFRADLLYRLEVCRIPMPPLRSRVGDIRLLAEHIIRAEHLDRTLEATALTAMERYAWPGNIRELRNRLVQAALQDARNVITAEALDLPGQSVDIQPTIEQSANILRDAEMQAIRDVLSRHRGNLGAAAAELKMHRVTLYRKLKRFGIG